MSKQVIRADLSALGFYLVLYVILISVAAAGILSVFMVGGYFAQFTGHSSAFFNLATDEDTSTLFTLAINAISQYLIGMPVMAYIIHRRLPTIAVRQGLPAWYELSGEDYGIQAGQQRGESAFGVRDLLMLIPVIVFLMFAGGMIGDAVAGLFGDVFGIEAQNSQVELLLSGDPVVTILFVVILAPLMEELFFRKLLIDQVKPISKRGAVLVSAVSFAFFHQNIYQFFYAFFIGAVFAYIYLRSENILYTILLHMGVNLYGGVILPALLGEAEDELAALSAGNVMATVAVVTYLGLAAAGLVILIMGLMKGWFRLRESYGAAPDDLFLSAYFSAPGMLLFMLSCAALSVVNLYFA